MANTWFGVEGGKPLGLDSKMGLAYLGLEWTVLGQTWLGLEVAHPTSSWSGTHWADISLTWTAQVGEFGLISARLKLVWFELGLSIASG